MNTKRTVGEFNRLTPEEKRADVAKFWREFASVNYNINRIGEDDGYRGQYSEDH
jgi:hypothetical protein